MTLAFLVRVPCEVKKSWVPSVSPSGDPQTDESRHTHLWVSSVLLSVELGTQAEDASAGCPCVTEGMEPTLGNPAELSCWWETAFLWCSICLAVVNLLSFSIVLTALVLTITAWFFFLCFCQIRECGASLLCPFADFSLWFWFAFLWWLMKLNVFSSYAY